MTCHIILLDDRLTDVTTMMFRLQRSFCGNYSNAGHYKHERPNSKMSVLQDYAERIITVHSEGMFFLFFNDNIHRKLTRTHCIAVNNNCLVEDVVVEQ